MSELENLCQALEESVQPLPSFAGALQQRAARLRSVATQVEQAARQVENGPNVGHVVQGLHEAAADMDASSRSLSKAVQQSRSFVTRTIGGGGAGAIAGTSGSPTNASQRAFGGAVTASGRGHPSLVDQRGSEVEWVPGSGEGGPPGLASVQAQSPPEGWAHLVNGTGIDSPGRDNNCVDCARSVESTWRGSPTMSAAMADFNADGTSASRVTEWSRGSFVKASYGDVERRLNDLGDGSSAILVSSWSGGRGGHAYNAVNDRGAVKFIDGQSATVSGWPPSSWSESQTAATWAVFFDRQGNPAS